MTDLQWVGTNLLTGAIIADLPDIELTSPLAVTIGQYESAQAVLHVQASTNPDWLAATQQGGAGLIAWSGDPASPTIVWGGIAQQRVRTLSNAVQLALVTPEAYLDACYVGDYTATNINQDTIFASLMAFASGGSRIPVNLNHLPAASTQTQSVAYLASSQTTVYAALQSLSGVTGGPEWTMDWVWNLAAGTILPRMNYGARIGQPVLAGNQPNVTFEIPDLMSLTVTEDYSVGHGANDVTAFGTAPSGGSIPSAEAAALNTNGRPLWGYAYQPNQTVTDSPTLATYAQAAVTQMQDGGQSVALSVTNNLPGKRFGMDWSLGDDIGFNLSGTLAFPVASSGTARCIGYQADTTTITPILTGVSLS